jgi:hypothetical protein
MLTKRQTGQPNENVVSACETPQQRKIIKSHDPGSVTEVSDNLGRSIRPTEVGQLVTRSMGIVGRTTCSRQKPQSRRT